VSDLHDHNDAGGPRRGAGRDRGHWRRRRGLALVASGYVKPGIDRTFPLSDIAEAHRDMESRQHIGKILIEETV